MKILIGVDPGTKTGIAVSFDGQLTHVRSFTILKAISFVNDIIRENKDAQIKAIIEDPNQRKWYGEDAELKAQGAGSVKRDFSIWTEHFEYVGIEYEAIEPVKKGTKLNKTFFKQLTKWKGRTSEHARDAAMMIFKRKF